MIFTLILLESIMESATKMRSGVPIPSPDHKENPLLDHQIRPWALQSLMKSKVLCCGMMTRGEWQFRHGRWWRQVSFLYSKFQIGETSIPGQRRDRFEIAPTCSYRLRKDSSRIVHHPHIKSQLLPCVDLASS